MVLEDLLNGIMVIISKYKTKTIKCSKIWVYWAKDRNHNILKLQIGDQIYKIDLHTNRPKINSTLVFESDNLPIDKLMHYIWTWWWNTI